MLSVHLDQELRVGKYMEGYFWSIHSVTSMLYRFRLFSPFVYWGMFVFQLLASIFLIAHIGQSVSFVFLISVGSFLCLFLLPSAVVVANHRKQLGKVVLNYQNGVFKYSDKSQALDVEFILNEVRTVFKVFPSALFSNNGVQAFFLVEVSLVSGRILLLSCMHGIDVAEFPVVLHKNTFLPLVPDASKRESNWSSKEESWYK